MRVLLAIVTCCLLMLPGQASAQLRPQGQTLSTITPEQFASIVKDAGYGAQQKENSVIVKINKLNVIAWFFGCGDGGCGAYGLTALWKDKTTLEKVNKFNADTVILKAIMLEDNSIRIDMYSPLQGGVSSQNIVSNIEVFASLMTKAAELVQ